MSHTFEFGIVKHFKCWNLLNFFLGEFDREEFFFFEMFFDKFTLKIFFSKGKKCFCGGGKFFKANLSNVFLGKIGGNCVPARLMDVMIPLSSEMMRGSLISSRVETMLSFLSSGLA